MLEGFGTVMLGDVIRFASGQVDPKNDQNSKLLNVGPENIETGGGIAKDSLKTAGEIGLISGKYAFDSNAILYSKIRPNLNKVGLPDFSGLCSADVYPIWPKSTKSIDRFYLYYVLTSERFVSDATARSFRTGLPKINRPDLETIEINLPPLSEQRKIAEILRTWDEAIEKTARLIAAKELQHKAFVFQTVFGKIRLTKNTTEKSRLQFRWLDIPSDWKAALIGSIASEVSERNEDESVGDVLSCSKYDGFARSLDYFRKQVYSSDLSGYKKIWRGDFGFPSNHVEEGSIGLQNLVDVGIVSPIYTVFRFDRKPVNADYAFAVLKTSLYRHIFEVSTSASVDRRGSLRWSEFSKLPFPLPSLDEQNAISAMINDHQSLLKTLRRQKEALIRQKRGLMQKLLTGEWRVSSTAERRVAV